MSDAPVVDIRGVDIVFGDQPQKALGLLDGGEGREEILEKTGLVVGVADASIAVEQGEIFVLMGLSGSGKSTLLRAVNRLNKVTRGEVLIADEGTVIDVTSCDEATLRRLRTRRIAMVFQQFALLPWRTVAENVGFGLELRGVGRTERESIVRDKLELVNLDQWADKFAHELSGGMQQRVGLARAFATDADILLMDEPFSALDPLIRDRLQDELLELQTSLNKTILFVSHDLDEALKIGSRIAIMEGGHVIQAGTPEEIITNPATDYVRQFVANVNPLNVLRGATLMRPIADLERDQADPAWVYLDDERSLRARLDPAGHVDDIQADGRNLQIEPCADDGRPETTGASSIVCGRNSTPMRVAIETLHATGRPMPLLDGDGTLLGVIGARELLEGMLRRPRSGAGQQH